MISGGRRAPRTLNFAFVAGAIFAPGYLPYLGDPLENSNDFLSCSSSTPVFALSLMLSDVPVAAPFLFADGNYEKAIECTKTYLLFFPNDEVMNQNLAYYTAVLGENLAGPIQPREVSRDVFSPPWGPLQRF